MKKLFFTALVAVAAIGGAYAQTLYIPGTDQELPCAQIDLPTCQYSQAAEEEFGPGVVNVSTYTRTIQ